MSYVPEPDPPSYAESIASGAPIPAGIPSSGVPLVSTNVPSNASAVQPPPAPAYSVAVRDTSLVELEPTSYAPAPLPCARLMFYAHLVLRALGADVPTGRGLPRALVHLVDYRNHHLLTLPEIYSLLTLVDVLSPMRLEGAVLAYDESLLPHEPFRLTRVNQVSINLPGLESFGFESSLAAVKFRLHYKMQWLVEHYYEARDELMEILAAEAAAQREQSAAREQPAASSTCESASCRKTIARVAVGFMVAFGVLLIVGALVLGTGNAMFWYLVVIGVLFISVACLLSYLYRLPRDFDEPADLRRQ